MVDDGYESIHRQEFLPTAEQPVLYSWPVFHHSVGKWKGRLVVRFKNQAGLTFLDMMVEGMPVFFCAGWASPALC